MNCHGFEAMLERLLEGSASAAERTAAGEHTASCRRCRELEEMVRGIGLELPEPPGDLAAGVLERTSGSACSRARQILCLRVDGSLEGVDADLLELHLEHCAECAALGVALIRMQEDLPTLALADPGPGFTEEVLAATLPLSSRLARLGRRLRQQFERLTRRPRFAWEAAYVGAMILMLIFGTPLSPLRQVPGQALALAQVNPVHALAASPVGQVPGVMASWGQGAWEATGGRVLGSSREWRADMAVRLRRAGEASKPLLRHGADLGAALLRGNLQQGLSVLKSMGGDLVTIWNRLVAQDEARKNDEPDERA
jgi:predicted anti-sigma-YlaC factor YlaD